MGFFNTGNSVANGEAASPYYDTPDYRQCTKCLRVFEVKNNNWYELPELPDYWTCDEPCPECMEDAE